MKNSRDKREPRRTKDKIQGASLTKKNVEKLGALDRSIDTLSDSYTVAESVASGAAGYESMSGDGKQHLVVLGWLCFLYYNSALNMAVATLTSVGSLPASWEILLVFHDVNAIDLQPLQSFVLNDRSTLLVCCIFNYHSFSI